MMVFAFCLNNDYNSRSIKICLFLLLFSLYYAVNALFFDDDTMHRIYIDKGNYYFLYQIRNILYSTLISAILGILLKFLALTENSIISIKNNYNEQKNLTIKKCNEIKIVFYFILNFTFLFVLWYYLSCFGAIYKNTQLHLLKDTLVTFGLSSLYPVGLCLLPGFFRIPSLRAIKQNKECLYQFSNLMQDLI